jgi:hypothetical protein
MARNFSIVAGVLFCLAGLTAPAEAQYGPDNRPHYPWDPRPLPGHPGIPPYSDPHKRREEKERKSWTDPSHLRHLQHAVPRVGPLVSGQSPSTVKVKLSSYKAPASSLGHEAGSLSKSKGLLAGIGAAIAGFFAWLFGRRKMR